MKSSFILLYYSIGILIYSTLYMLLLYAAYNLCVRWYPLCPPTHRNKKHTCTYIVMYYGYENELYFQLWCLGLRRLFTQLVVGTSQQQVQKSVVFASVSSSRFDSFRAVSCVFMQPGSLEKCF